VKDYLHQIIKTLLAKKVSIIVFGFILVSFLINTLHTQFPDEFDNIYGGFLINQGKLPYTGFFTHHNPGAYYLASIITLISGRSFVLFRIIFSLLLFAFYCYSYYLLKKHTRQKSLHFFLLYGMFISIGATYWWGQMLLSETVVGYLLVPAFLLIIIKRLHRIRFDKIDIVLISILSFFSLFISLTYIYLIPFVYAVLLYYYFSDHKPPSIKDIVVPLGIIIIPYILFGIYLIVTGSIHEFYFASIYYNVNYYIYNFPKVGDTFSHNPLRYAISIAKHTSENFTALLAQIHTFNFDYPFNVSLALGNVAIIIYFLIKREFTLAFLIISMIFYTNARSEPLTSSETDFHATVYIMITLSLVSYFFFAVKDAINKKTGDFNHLVLSFIFITTAIYWLFTVIFLSNKFLDKAYSKYMGLAPLIYDRPQAAQTINKIVGKDEYFWIGPFELQELLFIQGKVASKYYWFLPANSRDDKIKSEIRDDLLKNKPKVIVFKKWYSNFGVKPEDFNGTIVAVLNDHYFQISDLRKEGLRLKVDVSSERNFNFEDDFYFYKDKKDEIINLLFEKKLIERI